VNIYKQFASSEHEKKVLEESNEVLAIIGQRGKKSMQSKFKDLFPMWFLIMNDTNQEVQISI
jgi:phosphoribosyl-ATP pyrophosphohydrolase